MSGLVDASGREIDPILTPKQNLALHQQTRQMVAADMQRLGEYTQDMFYKQAMFIEYIVNLINKSGLAVLQVPTMEQLLDEEYEFTFDSNVLHIDDESFSQYAEGRHQQISEQVEQEKAELAAREDAEVAEAARTLLAQGEVSLEG